MNKAYVPAPDGSLRIGGTIEEKTYTQSVLSPSNVSSIIFTNERL